MLRRLIVLLVALVAQSCVHQTGPDGATVTRREVIKTAREYTALRWIGSKKYAFHGIDADGLRVDTPDALAGTPQRNGFWWKEGENVGMPYQWGGFDTPRQFLERLASGQTVYAGDYASPAKVSGGDAVVSRYAAGVDCSGLVSRCWGLPRPYSTSQLPSICRPLDSIDELEPGDILLRPGEHVQIFVRWENKQHTHYRAIEAAGIPEWRCFEIIYPRNAFTKHRGFTPWRYCGIRD